MVWSNGYSSRTRVGTFGEAGSQNAMSNHVHPFDIIDNGNTFIAV